MNWVNQRFVLRLGNAYFCMRRIPGLTITLMSLAFHEHQEDYNNEMLFAFI